MLTGSFGHETSDIVSRIQTSLLLVNLYLDNGMDINQIKDVVSIVSGDFDRIYAYSNLIVNFLRKRKRTIDSEINLSSALKEVGGFYQTIVKSFDITLNFVCEDTIEYKIKQIDFESIVINMITNAFEQVKGRENRKITVTISQSASHLIIYFEDSGTGVPEGKEKEISSIRKISIIESLEVNQEHKEVKLNGKKLSLTDLEYEILDYLLLNRKQVISASQLFEAIWYENYYYGANNTIMVHIRNLKRR